MEPEGIDPCRKAAERGAAGRAMVGKVQSRLAAIGEAARYPGSVRLQALLPNWMPSIGQHNRISPRRRNPC
jgi:hypothetical protein